jgi:hypothetical protein
VSRLLVTGSRAWTDVPALRARLWQAVVELGGSEAVTLVHGGCPLGADAMAMAAWGAWGLGLMEVFPPDLARHGSPWAYRIRNQQMVNAGAALCLAFVVDVPGCSRGTRMTMGMARRAGIPVVEVVQSQEKAGGS